MKRVRPLVRLLLRLYPRELRRRNEAELEEAFLEILSAERARRGAIGVIYAWLGCVVDARRCRAALMSDVRLAEGRLGVSQATLGLWLRGLAQDIRFAVRIYLRTPGPTLLALTTVAFGIAAGTIVFSLAWPTLMELPDVYDPARISAVYEHNRNSVPSRERNTVSAAEYFDWRSRMTAFESMGAHQPRTFTLRTGDGEPEQIRGAAVTASFLDVLRVEPILGRRFEGDGELAAGGDVVLISDDTWNTRFARDPATVGRVLFLSERPHTIIGVLPARAFSVTRRLNSAREDLWIPLSFTAADATNRAGHGLRVLARLQDGVSLATARAEAGRLAAALERENPRFAGHGISVFPLQDELGRQVRPLIVTLCTAVGFVMLLVSANAGNFVLARAASRQAERTTREALGASRARLLQQAVTEGVLLTGTAAAVGMLLAWWGLAPLLHLGQSVLPLRDDITVDIDAVLFGLTVAIGMGSACGLLSENLRSSAGLRVGHRVGPDGPQRKLRDLMVVAQLTVCVVLMTGAGLMIASFARLSATDPGYRGDGVLSLSLPLLGPRYERPGERNALVNRLLGEVRRLPGVQSAAVAGNSPALGSLGLYAVTVEGRRSTAEDGTYDARYNRITPDYFSTLGVPLIAGRDFTDRDDPAGAAVVVVNEEFVRVALAGEDPVGWRLSVGANRWATVVGVVGSTRRIDAPIRPEVYQPFLQVGTPSPTLLVRITGDPVGVTSELRAVVRRADRSIAWTDVRSLRQVVAETLAPRRFVLFLMVAFGGLALFLAAGAVYGSLSYSVSQRTREIGLRLALGAPRQHVMFTVMRDGTKLCMAGVALGLFASALLSRVMERLLFGVTPYDVPTASAVSAILLVSGMLASYVPARRAIQLDPRRALE